MLNFKELYPGLDNITKKYSPYFDVIDEACTVDPSRYNKFQSDIERTAFAVLMNNTAEYSAKVRGSIDESAVGGNLNMSTLSAIAGIETSIFDLITGTATQMLSYRCVAVQPIQTPNAYVYYFNFKYANEKGGIAAGTNFISHLNQTVKGYAGNNVFGESSGTTTASTGEFTTTLKFLPLIPGSIILTCDGKTAKDNGSGTFTGDLVKESPTNNTINYATGEIKLTTAVTTSTEVKSNYKYNTEVAPSNPIVAELVSVPVTAEVKTLKATSTLVAVLNSRSVLGVDLADASMEVATRELAAEFDYDIFSDLLEGAPTSVTVEKLKTGEFYDTFIRRYEQTIENCSNSIFNATQKLEASFIVAGTDHAAILPQSIKYQAYDNRGNYASGPRLVGRFNGLDVIKVPTSVYPANVALIGAKSDIPVLGAGYIFAPYIMAYPSQLIADADLKVSQGFVSIAAKKMVNSSLYVKLTLV